MTSSIDSLTKPFIVAVLVAVFLLLVRSVGLRLLQRWAKRSETEIDDIIIKSIRTPSIFWSIAIALYVGLIVSPLQQNYILYISKAIYVIVILSVTIVVANLTSRVFKSYIHTSKLPIPTTGLVYGIINGIIYIIGLLIILSVIGISIAPLVTALGVGGLAVALALQDTLANLFAGIHILMEKSIRIGDFVRLESGQEGYIEDITWRTTRIRMLQNNMVVIPNSKLSQSVVTNYYLPEKRMAVPIHISVSYSHDPERVEQILLEEAGKAANDVPGLLSSPEPVVRFIPGFGESSLDFTLICHVREFADQFSVQHELRKRIFKRFKKEGIEIPYPHRVVFLKDDVARPV